MPTHPSSRRIILAVLTAALTACSSKKPPAPPEESGGLGTPSPPGAITAAISAKDGGRVGNEASAHAIVPPGAVDRDVKIALAQAPADTHVTQGVRMLGQVCSFKVDGQEHFAFAKPVRIAVPYDASRMLKDAPVSLSVWQDDRWQKVPGSHADDAAKHVVADVDHFSDYAPTQDEAGDALANALEAARKRLLENEYWYGHLTVVIRGAGHRKTDSGEASYSIARESELSFRIHALQGEIATAAAMERAMKQSPIPLPKEFTASYDELRVRRHWMSEMINRSPDDETDFRIGVNDRQDSSGKDVEGEGGPVVTASSQRTLKGGDSGKKMAIHQLEIDLGKGIYKLKPGDIRVDRRAGGPILEIRSSSGDPTETTEHAATLAIHLPDQPLPSSGNVLTGTMRIPESDLDGFIGEVGGSWALNYGSRQGTISWTLSPVPLEDVELVITPEGYDEWLPRGGQDESTRGNSIKMKASIRRRGGGAVKAKMKSIVVRIDGVSRVPGVCLNRPLSGGASAPDLKFAPSGGVTIDEEGTRLKKEGEFSEVPMEVECYDWGAWGAVVAQATLTDGRPVWATLDGDPSMDEVRLPKREAKSRVGDKWKAEMGVEGRDDKADADKQKGNRKDGDGLTLYEEYRGLIARGKHTRDHAAGADGLKPLSPKSKDLIVRNTIEKESSVDRGLRLFETASGIHVVEVDDGELPASRQVNVNAEPSLTAGPQFGLILVNEQGAPGAVGQAQQAREKVGGPSLSGSPRGYPKVIVDLAAERANHAQVEQACALQKIKMPYTLDEEIASTVAHELAHGLGADHHGHDTPVRVASTTITAGDPMKVYDRDGSLITTRPFTLGGDVGDPGNVSSGDVNCVMCYNNVYTWSYHLGLGYFAAPVLPAGKLFCTDGKGTGPNGPRAMGPGKPPLPGIFGSGLGNCLGKMRVKDQ